MYYYSKTQCMDHENFSPNYFFEQPTLQPTLNLNQAVLANDQALSKAIGIIEQLRDNLAFALKVNETLSEQNEKLRQSASQTTKKVNIDREAWQAKLKQIQSQKQQIVELLQQTKGTLLQSQKQNSQKRGQLQKKNRIIMQLKKSYEELQQNFMNQSLNNIGNTSSFQLDKNDLIYISELEQQNVELNGAIKKYEQQIQKYEGRITKLEKQNQEFKKWMGSVLGLQKVVEGSEKILMRQIANRMLPS